MGTPVLICPGQQSEKEGNKMGGLLYTIVSILFVLWLVGLLMNFGGGLIHILLVLAVVILVYQLVTGRRAV
jgi:hypothetical protein